MMLPLVALMTRWRLSWVQVGGDWIDNRLGNPRIVEEVWLP